MCAGLSYANICKKRSSKHVLQKYSAKSIAVCFRNPLAICITNLKTLCHSVY